MKTLAVALLCLFSLSSSGFAQNETELKGDTIWLVSGFLKDEGRLWASPFRIKKKDLFLWIPVIATTALSIQHDEEIYKRVKDYQATNPWIDDISPIITWGGDGTVNMGISASFYLGGLIFKNNKAMQTGLMSAQALGHAGIIVTVGKQLTSRKRPHGSDWAEHGKDKWHWFPNGLREFTDGEPRREYDAFPSGHTISAWTLGTVIAKQYKDKKWVAPICYTLATGVALSRITEDTHWLSDVILGAALGYGIGRNMSRMHKDTKWTLLPTRGEKNIMLTGIYSF